MPSGGKRNGAGRKRGSPNKATAERQQEIIDSGVTPLEVLIAEMRFHYTMAELAMKAEPADIKTVAKALEAAHEAAKDAAPYVHPRLAAIEHSGDVTTTTVIRAPNPSASTPEWQEQHTPKPLIQ